MDMQPRISRLFSKICKSNTLKELKGKEVGDPLIIEGRATWITQITGSGRVGDDSYFLVVEDSDELNALSVELSRTNPTIIAPEDVRRYLGELIWKMEGNGWSRRGILQDIEKVLQFIKQYKGEEATVTVPVWGLNLGDSPFTIGNVQFVARPFPQDVEDELKSIDPDGRGINTVAITTSKGDQAIIFDNAIAEVNRAINIIRAFAYPIAKNNQWQELCTQGDYRKLHSFGLLNYKQQSEGFTYIKSVHGVRVGSVIPFNIHAYLPYMNLSGFNEILSTINKNDKFSKSLIKAADWLGESTKPDVLQSKFVKVAFSIDAMIGDASEDIPDKGKRARIAERAAFLLGKRYKTRNWIYNNVRGVIGKRDAIAHGSNIFITESDVDEAGNLTKALLRRLLLEQPRFNSLGELATWVKRQSLLGSTGRPK